MALTIDKIGRAQTRLLENKKSELEARQNDPRRGRPEERLTVPDRALLEAINQELQRRVMQQQAEIRGQVGSALAPDTPANVPENAESVDTEREKVFYLLLGANAFVLFPEKRANLHALAQETGGMLNKDLGKGLISVSHLVEEILEKYCEELPDIFAAVQLQQDPTGHVAKFALRHYPTISVIVEDLSQNIQQQFEGKMNDLSTHNATAMLLTIAAIVEQKLHKFLQLDSAQHYYKYISFGHLMLKELLVKLKVNIPEIQTRALNISSHLGQTQAGLIRPLNPEKMRKFDEAIKVISPYALPLQRTSANLLAASEEIHRTYPVLVNFPQKSLPVGNQATPPALMNNYGWLGAPAGRIGRTTAAGQLIVQPWGSSQYLIITKSDIYPRDDPPLGTPLCLPDSCIEQAMALKRAVPHMMQQAEGMLKILCPAWKEQEEVLKACVFIEDEDHLHILYPINGTKPLLLFSDTE